MKKVYTLVLFLMASLAIHAQSGVLDTSFGNNGLVLSEFNPVNNYGEVVEVQSNGKIVVAGYAGAPSTYKMIIARYNSDGSVDTSFANNGSVEIPVGSAKSFATALKIQTDGKIVVGGRTWDNVSGNMALVRLNIDGTLDNSFGSNGITIADNGGNEIGEAMAILANGKIVLAGDNQDNFTAAQFNADGTLDTNFGVNGWSTVLFDGNPSFVKDIAIQEDGKILLGGFIVNNSNKYAMAAARLNADGSADNTFGISGRVQFNVGFDNDFAEGIAVQADGKIFVGGHTYISTPLLYDFAVAKLNADGSFDTTYGENGVATAQIVNGSNYTRQMLLQDDGKVILTGYTVFENEYDMGMVRFNADGSPDPLFGSDGKVRTDVNGREDYATGINIQADNKILVTGYSYTAAGDASIVVARYDNTILGTEDFKNLDFRLYPNPTKEQITIEMSDASSNYVVSIFDILGKKVYTSEIQKAGNIDVSDLASGTYLVKLNSDNKSSVVRFVKQ